jgi:hypothetical protein
MYIKGDKVDKEDKNILKNNYVQILPARDTIGFPHFSGIINVEF